MTDLYFSLRHPKESFHNTSITLDCDQASMVTHHGKPMAAKVRRSRAAGAVRAVAGEMTYRNVRISSGCSPGIMTYYF